VPRGTSDVTPTTTASTNKLLFVRSIDAESLFRRQVATGVVNRKQNDGNEDGDRVKSVEHPLVSDEVSLVIAFSRCVQGELYHTLDASAHDEDGSNVGRRPQPSQPLHFGAVRLKGRCARTPDVVGDCDEEEDAESDHLNH